MSETQTYTPRLKTLYNETIRSGDKFSEVDLERHGASYLYNDGSRWYFMDDETFEQFDLAIEEIFQREKAIKTETA